MDFMYCVSNVETNEIFQTCHFYVVRHLVQIAGTQILPTGFNVK